MLRILRILLGSAAGVLLVAALVNIVFLGRLTLIPQAVFGGLLAAAQLGLGNALIGSGRLFSTITAVVVGGTALTGGEGGVLNTLVGVLIMAVLGNGMVLLGVSPDLQQAVQGILIIVAVALSLDRARLKIVK